MLPTKVLPHLHMLMLLKALLTLRHQLLQMQMLRPKLLHLLQMRVRQKLLSHLLQKLLRWLPLLQMQRHKLQLPIQTHNLRLQLPQVLPHWHHLLLQKHKWPRTLQLPLRRQLTLHHQLHWHHQLPTLLSTTPMLLHLLPQKLLLVLQVPR
jgi:hypothetical protein